VNSRTIDLLKSGFRTLIRALEESEEEDEWVDQKASPLGRRLHCEAARTGQLKAKKLNGRWLAKRSDVDAYIEAHGTRPPAERPEKDDATAVAEILEFRAPRRRRSK
jgi:hypothetical protein